MAYHAPTQHRKRYCDCCSKRFSPQKAYVQCPMCFPGELSYYGEKNPARNPPQKFCGPVCYRKAGFRKHKCRWALDVDVRDFYGEVASTFTMKVTPDMLWVDIEGTIDRRATRIGERLWGETASFDIGVFREYSRDAEMPRNIATLADLCEFLLSGCCNSGRRRQHSRLCAKCVGM
eukprot:TRINITY_DN2022_c0_g1_i1.p1 TRINITY_DN2022_c0_g1~~TRINITY_DN2022_c0_g1_i1.p1  ORF type:complete len:176 (+),score=14.51 TRINITY_DN2022_c0_g1_i1:596-1123(+)